MKILLLGLSGSGKSTIARMISQKFNLEIVEADDEWKKMNNGVWPDDEDVITKAFERSNENAICRDNLVYVISWMSTETIKRFFDTGFKIIEMHANYKELLKRKKESGKLTVRQTKTFESTYAGYFSSVMSGDAKDFYSLSLDTTHISPNEIFSKIIGVLK